MNSEKVQLVRFLTEEWGHWCEKELLRQNSCDAALSTEVHTRIDIVDDRVRANREDIVALKVKAGIWGLIGGAIPVVIYLLVAWLHAH